MRDEDFSVLNVEDTLYGPQRFVMSVLQKPPPDSWVEITEEELQQLEYIDDFEPREDIPTGI